MLNLSSGRLSLLGSSTSTIRSATGRISRAEEADVESYLSGFKAERKQGNAVDWGKVLDRDEEKSKVAKKASEEEENVTASVFLKAKATPRSLSGENGVVTNSKKHNDKSTAHKRTSAEPHLDRISRKEKEDVSLTFSDTFTITLSKSHDSIGEVYQKAAESSRSSTPDDHHSLHQNIYELKDIEETHLNDVRASPDPIRKKDTPNEYDDSELSLNLRSNIFSVDQLKVASGGYELTHSSSCNSISSTEEKSSMNQAPCPLSKRHLLLTLGSGSDETTQKSSEGDKSSEQSFEVATRDQFSKVEAIKRGKYSSSPNKKEKESSCISVSNDSYVDSEILSDYEEDFESEAVTLSSESEKMEARTSPSHSKAQEESRYDSEPKESSVTSKRKPSTG